MKRYVRSHRQLNAKRPVGFHTVQIMHPGFFGDGKVHRLADLCGNARHDLVANDMKPRRVQQTSPHETQASRWSVMFAVCLADQKPLGLERCDQAVDGLLGQADVCVNLGRGQRAIRAADDLEYQKGAQIGRNSVCHFETFACSNHKTTNSLFFAVTGQKVSLFDKKRLNLVFDYIIVGAGSSGCAIAARLSENGKYSVALIEAGGKDRNPWIHIPVGYFKTMGNPKTDWMYETQSDAGINGRSIKWPRGRVLGGSSSINGLLYVRGQAQDFDHWRQLGNEGWGWDDVLPHFKKAETWNGDSNQDDLRGKDGPLSVSPTRLSRDVVDKWVEAAQSAGYPYNEDYNGTTQEGVGYFQLTSVNGRRCSSAVAYLKPARGRANLKVITNTQTEKVLVEEGRAVGIRAMSKGASVEYRARKEVILSAGAIGSPQILMLSGIGDPAEMKPHGIEVVKQLNGVGKNLQDHLQARPIFKTDLSTINIETNNLFKQGMIAMQYAATRNGPMTMAASLGTAFLKTDARMETPDIQFHIQPFSANNAVEGPHPFSAFTASVLQMRPESAGHLSLVSSNPLDHPHIHPNYLATDLDQQTIVKGIQIARKIALQEPLKSHITEEYAPGRDVPMDDEAGTLDWARQTSVTIYHPTGTCKMGKDPMAVVDARLRVHGIDGLRVADCSIMPVITSGNTNAPAIMIGEKASQMILEDAV